MKFIKKNLYYRIIYFASFLNFKILYKNLIFNRDLSYVVSQGILVKLLGCQVV
jgi:hypothetical protein